MTDETEGADDAPKPRKPRRRPPGLVAVAMVLAIAGLLLAGWTAWRFTQANHLEQAQRQQGRAAIAGLQQQLANGADQTKAASQRLANVESTLADLRAKTRRLGDRVANAENSIAALSGQQHSAHDTILLNDAELLLRNAEQRYELFHDDAGALKAYQQAIDVLARVHNPAYAAVRASAISERDALAAAAPPARQTTLDTLSKLRSDVATLPLVATSSHATTPVKPGFWSRVAGAFSGIVSVTRETPHGAPATGTAFARQALAVDLAQAQEALLAFDEKTYQTALQRAQATLAAEFATDTRAASSMRVAIGKLLAAHPSGTAPTLGGALAQLQSMRASQPAAASTTAPPPAGSTIAPPATSGAPLP